MTSIFFIFLIVTLCLHQANTGLAQRDFEKKPLNEFKCEKLFIINNL